MQNIYDNNAFFEEYEKMREKDINANNLIEQPIFYSLLPSLKDKKVLDIGCGTGGFCRTAKNEGASFVMGIDCSKNMLEVAKRYKDDITYLNLPMENLSKLNDKFDVITSSLAFHYVKDFDKLIYDISNLIKPGGELIFSQEHPVATAFIPPKGQKLDNKIDIHGKRYYLLSDYNNLGIRIVTWNVTGVEKYHRNFSDIINTLIRHGFMITNVTESYADSEVIKKEPKYKYQNDRPYFIFISAKKL